MRRPNLVMNDVGADMGNLAALQLGQLLAAGYLGRGQPTGRAGTNRRHYSVW